MTRQLMHLVAAVDHGSLTRAAQALNLTQPALTRSIRYLESEVGAKLLERGREGTTPTKLGKTLYIHGKNIIASLERASADVRAWHHHDSGHLIVGSTSLPSVYFVPNAIASFLSPRSKVGLRFEVHPFNDLLNMLRQGTLDVFVGALGIERLPENIQITTLLEDELAVICGPQHPLAKRRKYKITELADYPWLLPSNDTALRQQAESVFLEFGLPHVDIAIETIAAAALVPIMNQGNYLTLHSKYLLAPDIETKKLVLLPIDVPGAGRLLTAFHRPIDEMAELTRAFISHLKGYAANS